MTVPISLLGVAHGVEGGEAERIHQQNCSHTPSGDRLVLSIALARAHRARCFGCLGGLVCVGVQFHGFWLFWCCSVWVFKVRGLGVVRG